MKNLRRTTVLILTLLSAFTLVPVAFAHPLGNFTINHYAGLHLSRESIAVDFVLDMAEIPAFQEITTFDTNGNGQADPSEADAYHAGKCNALLADLNLALNDKSLGLTVKSSSVAFPAGAGGLPTLRLTCELNASIPNAGQMTTLSFADNSYTDRIGWREIIVTTDGITLDGDFTSTSISNRLTSYPQDLLSSPLDQRQITLGINSPIAPNQNIPADTSPSTPSIAGTRSDTFTQLITLQNITLPTLLFALLVSFLWGAMHAMTPGHGKTIVGAYLVGSRGTRKHAIYLGLTTTITHTLGVFVLGLITLLAAQYIVPEKLYPWMSLLSGLFVVGIGISLVVSRYRSSGLGEWLGKFELNRSRIRPAFASIPMQERNGEHNHRYVLAPPLARSNDDHHHRHAHLHGHDHIHHHSHDHGGHSHTPPQEITWRSLLALGVSGGLIPCPSALVVMLGAIALNRIGFGLVLVLAFSLGLAGALTAIGMFFIYAGNLFKRIPASGKVITFLPVVSAMIISLIGLGIVWRALTEMRVV